MWLEKVELGDGGQQTSPFAAVDFVSEQMALQGTFLNGVMAISTDEDAIPVVVLEKAMWAESYGRHGAGRVNGG